MINSLGSYVLDQLTLLGWSRIALVERSGIDDWQLDAILESPVLAEWPSPEVLLSLAKAFSVPVRDVVLRAAQGSGLHVEEGLRPDEALSQIGNEDLMREVRRRLALGAATGAYLATPDPSHPSPGVDSGAQFT